MFISRSALHIKEEGTDDAEEKGKAMLHFFVSEEREEKQCTVDTFTVQYHKARGRSLFTY